MTIVVLSYVGSPEERSSAEERLRKLLPDAVLVSKADNLVEARVEPSEIAKIEEQSDWAVSRPIYADFEKPRINLKNAREKMMKSRSR